MEQRMVEFGKEAAGAILLKCVRFVAQVAGGFTKILNRNMGWRDAAKMLHYRALFAAVKDSKRPETRMLRI
jgi:hypothetical protein